MKVTTDACLFGAWTAEQIKNAEQKLETCLDIGCGTGLLSLMIAQKNNLLIHAVEIDGEAANQANENAAKSPWLERIEIVHSDVLQWKPDNSYDCIVSNPPFYESELKTGNATKNVAHHDEGLKLRELFTFIKNHLRDEGIFFLLLPAKRLHEIPSLLAEFNFHLHKKVIARQSLQHSPFRILIQAGSTPMEQIEISEIAIKNNSAEYSVEFIDLLKDYYLYL